MSKNVIILIFFMALLSAKSFSQISEKGVPYSFSDEFKRSKASKRLQPIPEIKVVPDAESQRIFEQETAKGYLIEGVGVDLPKVIKLSDSGQWVDLENGDRIWRVKITADDAVSLNPFFEDFYLPRGAKLFLYSCDEKTVYGAYTHANNEENRMFNTVSINGNCIIIEYFEPLPVKGEGSFEIREVGYGFNKSKF